MSSEDHEWCKLDDETYLATSPLLYGLSPLRPKEGNTDRTWSLESIHL